MEKIDEIIPTLDEVMPEYQGTYGRNIQLARTAILYALAGKLGDIGHPSAPGNKGINEEAVHEYIEITDIEKSMGDIWLKVEAAAAESKPLSECLPEDLPHILRQFALALDARHGGPMSTGAIVQEIFSARGVTPTPTDIKSVKQAVFQFTSQYRKQELPSAKRLYDALTREGYIIEQTKEKHKLPEGTRARLLRIRLIRDNTDEDGSWMPLAEESQGEY